MSCISRAYSLLGSRRTEHWGQQQQSWQAGEQNLPDVPRSTNTCHGEWWRNNHWCSLATGVWELSHVYHTHPFKKINIDLQLCERERNICEGSCLHLRDKKNKTVLTDLSPTATQSYVLDLATSGSRHLLYSLYLQPVVRHHFSSNKMGRLLSATVNFPWSHSAFIRTIEWRERSVDDWNVCSSASPMHTDVTLSSNQALAACIWCWITTLKRNSVAVLAFS